MHRSPYFVLFLSAVVPAFAAARQPLALGAVRFEENRGQAHANVRFVARARGQQVFLTDKAVVFSPARGANMEMRFATSRTCQWKPDGAAADSISYFLGNDRSKWVQGAPVYDRVVWRDAWPGVDVAFHGDGDRLEYDFVLAPHADPSRIRVRFGDRAQVRIGAGGSVEIVSEGSTVRQRPPEIWQETPGGSRQRVKGRFVADGRNGLRLELAKYDPGRALVVDPVLEMATYVGGDNDDEIVAVADGIVVGNTRSLAFPDASPALRPGRDIFVRGRAGTNSITAFSGTVVFGGSGDDEAAAVALPFGGLFSVLVAGTTSSEDLPVPGSTKYRGGASDGFVVAFSGTSRGNPSLPTVGYVGGSGEDRITALASSGFLTAVVGVTDSPDLPAANAQQPALAGGKDAFYAFLSATTAIGYGYLGGSGDDAAYAVAARNSGTFWIGGQTWSPDFPSAATGLSGPSDAFLAQVTTQTSFFLANAPTTFRTWRFGGSGDDGIRALAVPTPVLFSANRAEGIAMAGVTTSADLPVIKAAQPKAGGDSDGFAGIWDETAAAPRWLTYLGGSGADEATTVAETWSGDLYVGGSTSSADLPVLRPLQQASGGGQDGMFAAYDYAGALQHLTYFGGSGDDRIRGVAVLPSFAARVVGSTASTDLPQRQQLQDRGTGMEGFIAEIGSDHFLGPASLILAKDGVASLAIRPARTSSRTPVTYRSSDPSRVRLVWLGRSFDEVTAAAEDGIEVEALADSGQAEIIASSPGLAPRTIPVTLYPGAFIGSQPGPRPLSTWSTSVYASASYCAVDLEARSIPACMPLRAGAPPPVFRWTASDPSVVRLENSTQPASRLQILRAGTATLTLTVDGYMVVQGTQTLTVAAPRPAAPAADFRIGRDLSSQLPVRFEFDGGSVFSGFRGTLTVRSGDPGKLLLSTDAGQPGAAQVSVAMSGTVPVIWAQALAGEGTVQVFLSATGSEGELAMPVVLEPAVLRWGARDFDPVLGTIYNPVPPLTAGGTAAGVSVGLTGQSGTPGQLRPGAAPLTFTLSNSNPQIVEVNRLSLTPQPGTGFTVLGLAAGQSTLTLTSSIPETQPVPASLSVTVVPRVEKLPALPSTLSVGEGLQARVAFSSDSGAGPSATITVDDPSALLVSASSAARGSASLTLSTTAGFETAFYLQGLRSSSATTVRVRFAGGERAIAVNLLPSGAGFAPGVFNTDAAGFNGQVRVVAYALDAATRIGVLEQIPLPGADIAVRFSAESPVRLDKSSGVLTAASPQITLGLTLPPAGQRSTITVTSDSGTPVSPVTATLKVGTFPSAGPVTTTPLQLVRGELGQVSIGAPVKFPATVTSSDPHNVLISLSPTAPGSASLQLVNASTLYVHALGEYGSFTLNVDSADSPGYSIGVTLRPLQLRVSPPYGIAVPKGGTAEFRVTSNASRLRPGVGPFRITVQTSNPSVATVAPASFDVGAGFAGSLAVTGVSPGNVQLTLSSAPDLYVVPPVLPVAVIEKSPPAPLPAQSLGVNLQASAQLNMGPNFSNPNGVIVTLRSSNPAVLLLSRSATTPGSASVVIAIPAGSQTIGGVYLQALAEGSATIQVLANGAAEDLATVTVGASWVSCGTRPVSLSIGDTSPVTCFLTFSTPQPPTGDFSLQDIRPRAGRTDLTLELSSSAPDIVAVTPASVVFNGSAATATLRGVSAGTATLKWTSPAAFGPAPSGSDALPVTVILPALTIDCPVNMVLGKDTQRTCRVGPASATVTATSTDPASLTVSADERAAGGGTTVFRGQITFQALAAYGTAEVLLTAPGYRDLRVPVVMRASEITLTPIQSGPLSLRVGQNASRSVSLRVSSTGETWPPRSGANLTLDLTTDQPGIITVEPARIVLDGPQSTGQVTLKGLAPGSTLLRVSGPPGFSVTGAPLAVSVMP